MLPVPNKLNKLHSGLVAEYRTCNFHIAVRISLGSFASNLEQRGKGKGRVREGKRGEGWPQMGILDPPMEDPDWIQQLARPLASCWPTVCSGQLSLLPSAGWKMSSGLRATR